MMATVAETKPLRWSSVRDCSRKAVYEATSAPARDRTLTEERQLYRGRSVGHDWVVSVASEKDWRVWIDSGSAYWLPPSLAAKSPEEADVVAEHRVEWEMGVGHADLYIRETDTVVEVLSSRDPSGDMIHSKLIQAFGYARALGASNIALIVVDPSTLEEERAIVTSGTARWDELAAECDERVAQVVAWRDSGEPPARVCGKPGDARGHFCLYAETCFEGWEPPEAEALDSEDAQMLAIRLNTVKNQRREIAATDKVLEAEAKEIQAELAEFVPPGEWQIGGYLVKRSPRKGNRSFDFDRAENDSRLEQILAEFVKTGTPHYVWDVKQTGPTATYEDSHEEVPF